MQPQSVDSSAKSVLADLLCRLTSFCACHAWLTSLVLMLSAGGCVYYTFHHLKWKMDRADLIDPSTESSKRWARYTELFGEQDDLVIVVEGEDLKTIKQALEDVGSRLAKRSDLFSSVLYKVDPGLLREKGLQYLPSDVLVSGLERLDSFRPILNGNWDLITLNGVVTRLHSQLLRLKVPAETQIELLHHADILTTSLVKTLRHEEEFTNPWPEILDVPAEIDDQLNQASYLLNRSGTMAFLMVTAIHAKDTFQEPTAAIDLVRTHLQEAGEKFLDVRFSLTGNSVLKNDQMRRSMSDLTTALIISFLGVAVLLYLGFRGILYPILGLCTLCMGLAWSFGYATFVVGHLNILSVSVAVMLMGLGIDFAIHFLLRYLENRHEGMGLVNALVSTPSKVGVGIITCAVTSSLACFCATFTSFSGVAELGIIAGGGILLCALAAFTMLPAIISVADRRTEVKAFSEPFQARLLRNVTLHHPWIVLLASLLCVGGIGYQIFEWSGPMPKLRRVYDHNLLHLQAEGLESVEAQQRIFESSRRSLLYAVSIADSAEEARDLKQKFERLGTVRQVQELATRLPAAQSGQTSLLVQGFRSQLSQLPAEPPEPRPESPATVGQSLERLQNILADRSDSTSKRIAHSIDIFLDELDPMSAKDQMTFLGEFQYRMSLALLEQFQSIAAASNPDSITIDDLPESLRARFVSPDGKWLLQIYPKGQIWDTPPLERFINDVRSVDPDVTGTPVQNYEVARQIKLSYEIWALYSIGMIMIALLLFFSKMQNLSGTFIPPMVVTLVVGCLMQSKHLTFSPSLLMFTFAGIAILMSLWMDAWAIGSSLLAVMPLIIGMWMTYGLLVVCGISVNPTNLVILPLIVGIGVNNGVHLLHDFHSKPNGADSLSPSTINAIMLTSTMIIVGFGSLMVSAHRGLYSLGAAGTIGVGACLFVSLTTLPALLTLISRHRQPAAIPVQIPQAPEIVAPLEITASISVPAEEPREPVVIQDPIHIA